MVVAECWSPRAACPRCEGQGKLPTPLPNDKDNFMRCFACEGTGARAVVFDHRFQRHPYDHIWLISLTADASP
jgi:hypothetical protein